ncbi:5-formyltetrahydrofolate cyclo-ligase [Bittarella massiliensis]|nr:5-formyltetrahydrofolate cyclo-ligase [Bittarella massiliensis (ex Durand et al. 2017)]
MARNCRQGLRAGPKNRMDTAIARRFFEATGGEDRGAVLYYSLPQEVDTRRIMRRLLAEGKRIYLPQTSPSGKMRMVRFEGTRQLAKGPHGVLEPTGSKILDKRMALPILVPGLAFDRRGYRVGYGGGHYDRYLKNYPGLKVGLCYEACLLDEIEVDPWDQPVDILLTEGGEYAAKR